jgi:hypothetical protein
MGALPPYGTALKLREIVVLKHSRRCRGLAQTKRTQHAFR